ncbi:hypothetical protein [Actomonas aquatica]|uniref:Uncharacterized protein n=1 Tax=Actomonas aquatica TaxID=2866162 RepID=A0ABZ1C2K8_9BACT|nr:hypothetical protein [Opitutus sp. WL0086]WRQ85701.1 hypothetical protein K1X11_012885 [Opitutus sp. WL0086]
MSKNPLILVTTYDALMADGRRVSWQGFRPASAAADARPTLYIATLPAGPDPAGVTIYNLRTVGAQATQYAVQLTVLAGDAQFKPAGGAFAALPVGSAVTVPAQGTAVAAELSFTSQTCTVQVVPVRTPVPGKEPMAMLGEDGSSPEAKGGGGSPEGGEGGGNPPPPIPGGEENP